MSDALFFFFIDEYFMNSAWRLSISLLLNILDKKRYPTAWYEKW